MRIEVWPCRESPHLHNDPRAPDDDMIGHEECFECGGNEHCGMGVKVRTFSKNVEVCTRIYKQSIVERCCGLEHPVRGTS